MRATVEGLNMPNGVAFRDGTLYVAEVSRVLRYDAIESRLDDGRERMNISNVMRRLTCERLASRSFDRVFYPPPEKATRVNPWMNARWVPFVALVPGLRSRSDCFGGVGKEGVLRPSPSEVGYGRRRSEGFAQRRVWRGATAVRPWGSTVARRIRGLRSKVVGALARAAIIFRL